MKIVILCDHYPVSPRVLKIRNSILKLHPIAEVRVIAWNRDDKPVEENFVDAVSSRIGYGNKIRKLFYLFNFIREVKKIIKEYQPDIINAIDIEMLFIAKMVMSKSEIVYEVYDIKFFENYLINSFREYLEKRLIFKNIKGMVLASPYFINYYSQLTKNKMPKSIIINNKPSKELTPSTYKISKNNEISRKITIGFIGTVRYKEILLNLIESSRLIENVRVLIAGGGPDFNYIKRYIENHGLIDKIILTGPYKTLELEKIYNECDYIWAAYPSNDENVKYAISNKFFESILYSKNVIVSEETCLGDTVEKYNLGFTVNPYSTENIENMLIKLCSTKKKEEFVKNSLPEWLSNYYWESEEARLNEIYHFFHE